MKKVLVSLVFALMLSAPAFAVDDLGVRTCGGLNCAPGGIPNETNTKTWATFRMAAILGCAPNNGNGCPQVDPGQTYALHVRVRCGPGAACAHAFVTAKAGDIPTIGNHLTWTNVTLAWSCSIGPHMRNICWPNCN